MNTPGVAAVVKKLVFGAEPIGAADAAALDAARIRQLSGRPGGGTPHFGMTGTPALTWSGWTVPVQSFVGQAQMGKARDAVVQTEPALPNASAPPQASSWLARMERMTAQGLL